MSWDHYRLLDHEDGGMALWRTDAEDCFLFALVRYRELGSGGLLVWWHLEELPAHYRPLVPIIKVVAPHDPRQHDWKILASGSLALGDEEEMLCVLAQVHTHPISFLTLRQVFNDS